jgi:hypothetical protein
VFSRIVLKKLRGRIPAGIETGNLSPGSRRGGRKKYGIERLRYMILAQGRRLGQGHRPGPFQLKFKDPDLYINNLPIRVMPIKISNTRTALVKLFSDNRFRTRFPNFTPA